MSEDPRPGGGWTAMVDRLSRSLQASGLAAADVRDLASGLADLWDYTSSVAAGLVTAADDDTEGGLIRAHISHGSLMFSLHRTSAALDKTCALFKLPLPATRREKREDVEDFFPDLEASHEAAKLVVTVRSQLLKALEVISTQHFAGPHEGRRNDLRASARHLERLVADASRLAAELRIISGRPRTRDDA
mgnify:CR=1 FL=1